MVYSQFHVKHKMPTELDKVKIRMNILSEEMSRYEKNIDLIYEKLFEVIQHLKRYSDD